MTFKLTRMSHLSHNKRQKSLFTSCMNYLTTAYLLHDREFRQNDALALQF